MQNAMEHSTASHSAFQRTDPLQSHTKAADGDSIFLFLLPWPVLQFYFLLSLAKNCATTFGMKFSVEY